MTKTIENLKAAFSGESEARNKYTYFAKVARKEGYHYIAKIFEELGGKVVYYGKPHKEIYKLCFKENEKVLAIGDNLRTDIKGANNLNKDSLFITKGVHRNEFNSSQELDQLFNKYQVRANYFQKELQW